MISISGGKLNKILQLNKINTGKLGKWCNGIQGGISKSLQIIKEGDKIHFITLQNDGKHYDSGLDISTKVEGNFQGISVNYDKFSSIFQTLDKERTIRLNKEENFLILEDGRRKGKCPEYLQLEHIPIIQKFGENSSEHEIDMELVCKSIERIIHAVAPKDEVRAPLKGINFEIKERKCFITAADGRRLATNNFWIDKAGGRFEKYLKIKDENGNELKKPEEIQMEDVTIILPEITVKKLLKLNPGKSVIKTQKKNSPEGIQIEFSIEDLDILFYSTRIDGTFPNFRTILEQPLPNKIYIDKKEVLKVLKTHKKFSDNLYKIEENSENLNFQSSLYISEEKMKIITGHEDYGEVEETLFFKEKSYFDKEIKIMINTGWLLDGIQGTKEFSKGEMTLKFDTDEKPVFVVGEDNYISIIIPIKKKEE